MPQRHEHRQRPLGTYLLLTTTFNVAAWTVSTLLGSRRRASIGDIALLGATTHEISRIVTKDKVTQTIRAPFVENEADGDETPKPSGPRRALGELLTCPYCTAPWISLGLNTLFLFGTTVYNGSPTNYTSEFDCVTNTWSIYANPTTGTAPYNNNDPSIGRISRYFAGFIPSTGRIFKIGGQNAAGSASRPTYNVYAYQASAVASTTVIGAGCTGAGGPMTLTADVLPWASRTVQATATGFAPTSFGFGLIGFSTQSTPLATLHPTGRAGCDLLVSPDASVFLVPAGGSAVLTLGMPADPVFAGVVLNTQVLQLELGAALQLSGISSTNGLALRLGAL